MLGLWCRSLQIQSQRGVLQHGALARPHFRADLALRAEALRAGVVLSKRAKLPLLSRGSAANASAIASMNSEARRGTKRRAGYSRWISADGAG